MNGTVPTDDERKGIFTNTMTADANGNPVQQVIYNPFKITCDPPQPPTPPCSGTFTRVPFANNVIDPQYIDKIGQALLKLYPEPNVTPDNLGLNNFRDTILTDAPAHQFDVKVDHHFNDKQRVAVRYSQSYSEYNVPFVLASGDFGDGQTSSQTVHNIGLEHNWNVTPTSVWTNRLALDRVSAPVHSNFPNFSAAGFPAILGTANGLKRMPTIQLDGANNWISMYTQCCTDTKFAHTLWTYSSAYSWVKRGHTFKFGFEQRQFFNNFWQPDNPTGLFNFPQVITADNPFDTSDLTKGNSFASLLVGFGAGFGSSFINIKPQVADKSMETAFYVQDDWKITPKLTINLGLRYEWSSPYTERFNRQQYSDFKGDTGIAVTLPDVSDPILNTTPPNLATPTELMGTTLFVNQGGLGRSVPTDRNNIAPRVGFAWSIDSRTVIRGGAGVYYGLNPATNFQYPGAAFFSTDSVFFTTDNYQTRTATLENPFPGGLGLPQGQKYGKLAQWGYGNGNNLGTEEARNADIYQWNLGVQHLFPWEFTIGVDYSANRSTHLPWGGYSSTRNRNFIPSAELARISAQLHAQDATCDDPNDNCVTNYLAQLVDNPFAQFFVGPNAIFNEPSALYAQTQLDPTTGQQVPQQIPLGYLLHPYPQFSGSFEGLPIFGANSWYNSMQVRFQKRMNHYFSVEGNYTYSKSMDNSSAGFNPFVGNLNNTSAGYPIGNPQQLDNLKKEWAVSANDATHRLVLATIVQVPVGKGRWIGKDMNRFLDGVVGGWSVSGIITKQSGQPLAVAMANSRLMDGNQRPNVICNNLSTGIGYHKAASTGNSILNASCFADPGDQVPGDAPRYFSQIRGDGIHNVDLSLSKEFAIRENMKLQFRGEFFNFTNTPRFAFPDVGIGSGTFGQVTSTAPGSAPRHTQFGLRFEF